jgi:hypothetical protein
MYRVGPSMCQPAMSSRRSPGSARLGRAGGCAEIAFAPLRGCDDDVGHQSPPDPTNGIGVLEHRRARRYATDAMTAAMRFSP